ncbi:unnamed protein product [Brassica oleracea]
MLLPYGPTLLFFFSCLMIYKRSTQNTNLYTWNNNHSTRW